MATIGQQAEPAAGRPASVQVPAAAPWGNSAPLALIAFAVTTFMISMINANVINVGAEGLVFSVAEMGEVAYGREILPVGHLAKK